MEDESRPFAKPDYIHCFHKYMQLFQYGNQIFRLGLYKEITIKNLKAIVVDYLKEKKVEVNIENVEIFCKLT